jgi:asparagine synthase (glutamine-hydrolysing)
MCGILFSSGAVYSDARFLEALDLMHHRGPDATGVVRFNQVILGHKRLKIIDLEDRSNQPFYSKDSRYILVFNGEIYNFEKLKRDNNINCRTPSDTEVLLELYERYGSDCLPMLDGMFSFVIFDTLTNKIFAARDRLGVKPLYIYQSREILLISSEISPILKLIDKVDFDDIGLRQYRKLRTFFNGRTAYKHVQMFPPGSYFEDGVFHKYWSLNIEKSLPPNQDELRMLIIEAVKSRLISDVPIGSFLSGGLDSSIISAVAAVKNTWTVGFENNNEFEWAKIMSEKIKSNHHEVLVSNNTFLPTAAEMIKKRREPLSVPNEVLLYLMSLEVKKKNTVILSGEGADELFFGYDRIFLWAANAAKWNIEDFSLHYSYGSNPDLEILEDAVSPFLDCQNPLEITAKFFLEAHLHGLLRRLDNSTMQASVEARVPLVDSVRLIERLSGADFSYKAGNGIVKGPLKEAFRYLLPDKIINRYKVGFPVPLSDLGLPCANGQTSMDRWLQFNLFELCGSKKNAEEILGVYL